MQVYAPTETSPVEEKDVFYEQLQTTLDDVPSYDLKLLLGDFNAKIGPAQIDVRITRLSTEYE